MEEVFIDSCPLKEWNGLFASTGFMEHHLVLGLRGKMRLLLLANILCNYTLAIYPGEVNFLGITHCCYTPFCSSVFLPLICL